MHDTRDTTEGQSDHAPFYTFNYPADNTTTLDRNYFSKENVSMTQDQRTYSHHLAKYLINVLKLKVTPSSFCYYTTHHLGLELLHYFLTYLIATYDII